MANPREHSYAVEVRWTGNIGDGTSHYRGYERSHEIRVENKPVISGSSDPAFRGDRSRYNPEELLVASLSACHMLWYLHLCSKAGVVVTAYLDNATGTMVETGSGGGHFSAVTLRPSVSIEKSADKRLAQLLHEKAHKLCFIANSVNFPIKCEPKVEVA